MHYASSTTIDCNPDGLDWAALWDMGRRTGLELPHHIHQQSQEGPRNRTSPIGPLRERVHTTPLEERGSFWIRQREPENMHSADSLRHSFRRARDNEDGVHSGGTTTTSSSCRDPRRSIPALDYFSTDRNGPFQGCKTASEVLAAVVTLQEEERTPAIRSLLNTLKTGSESLAAETSRLIFGLQYTIGQDAFTKEILGGDSLQNAFPAVHQLQSTGTDLLRRRSNFYNAAKTHWGGAQNIPWANFMMETADKAKKAGAFVNKFRDIRDGAAWLTRVMIHRSLHAHEAVGAKALPMAWAPRDFVTKPKAEDLQAEIDSIDLSSQQVKAILAEHNKRLDANGFVVQRKPEDSTDSPTMSPAFVEQTTSDRPLDFSATYSTDQQRNTSSWGPLHRLPSVEVASVASGTTSSSKAPKCHMCNGLGEFPAQCKTCTRRYHSYCLPEGPGTEYASEEWQCSRCTRKAITLKRSAPIRLESAVEDDEMQESTDEPVAKKRRVAKQTDGSKGEYVAQIVDNFNSGRKESNAQPKEILDTVTSTLNDVSQAKSDKHALPTVDRKKGNILRDSGAGLSSEMISQAPPSVPQVMGSVGMKHPVDEDSRRMDLSGTELSTASSAHGAIPSQLPRTGPSKIRPTKVPITRCSKCRRNKVPRNPSGKPVCSMCKEKDADANNARLLDEPGNDSLIRPPAADPGNETDAENVERPKEPMNNSLILPPTANANEEADADDAELLRESENSLFISPHTEEDTSKDIEPSASLRPKPSLPQREKAAELNPDQLLGLFTDPADHTQGEARIASVGEKQNATLAPLLGQREEQGSPAMPKNKHGQVRTSQHVAAVDEYDLGNSHQRPAGTYRRLFEMALFAAPDHRVDAKGVADWVSKNIPGYDKSVGIWAKGIQSTMIMNAKGTGGTILARKITQMDSGRSTTIFELLPGLVDELEYWDSVKQQPVLPLKRRKVFGASATREPDEHTIGKKASCKKHRLMPKPPSKQCRNDANGRSKPPETGPSRKDVNVGLDISPQDDATALPGVATSDDEPLMTRQSGKKDSSVLTRKSTVANSSATTVEQANGDTMDWECHTNTPNVAITSATARSFHNFKAQPGSQSCMKEEHALRMLVHIRARDREYSAKYLSAAWPEHDPKHYIDPELKIEEIKRRPRRKQLFGQNPCHSVLGKADILRARDPRPSIKVSARSTEPQALTDDGTLIQRFDSLEEFLGLASDLVPVIHEKQLAFRPPSGRTRVYYKTGIMVKEYEYEK